MNKDEALGIAAQCWCDKETEDIVMDPRLAEAFAKRLMKIPEYDFDYPCNFFDKLISKNSPYAFYIFQWVPYQTDAKKWRLKMNHDVKTFDGREAFGIWPNGSSCGPFKDEEVEFIRISKDTGYCKWEDPRDTEG